MTYTTRSFFHRCLGPVLLAVYCLAGSIAQAQKDNTEIASRIIIIGDAGKLHNGSNNVTSAVSRHIKADDATSTIVFAGDNIYPKGLPEKEDKNYEAQAHVLKTLVLSFKNYKARVYVIPGPRTWPW